jgi:hypothetical protein
MFKVLNTHKATLSSDYADYALSKLAVVTTAV